MNTQNKKKSREQGVALVAVMLVLLLVTAMAAGIIILTNTETSTSSNFKDEQRAFFAAKAGVEEARDRLRAGNSNTITRPTTLVGNGSTGVLYITNALNGETVAPWTSTNKYADDEICNETFSGASLTCTTNSATGKKYPSGSYYTTTTADTTTFAPSSGSVLDWKWSRVTLKQNNAFGTGYYVNGNSVTTSQVYWNGNHECVSGTGCTLPVYVITSLAITPSGSRRMTQMEVAQDQVIFNAPSALTLDGTSDSFSGGDSSNYQINGNDQGGCGSSASSSVVPAVGVNDGAKGTPNTGDVGTVISGIPPGRTGNYTGLGIAPDVENISASLPSAINSKYDLSTVSGLQDLSSAVKNAVTEPVVTGPASSLSNYGTASAPQIVYVNGDLTLTGNTTGYGILVVTGTLTVKGTVQWNGLVLVVGQGNLQMDGTNNFTGAVIVAKTKDTSGNTLSTLGSPTFGVNGGGNTNGGVFYSASCLAQATQLTTFHSVSFRELLN
jgi:Tfp pilus assembly protein PilX